MPSLNRSSLIFPTVPALPQALNTPRQKSDILHQIRGDPLTFRLFQSLKKEEQDAFVGFCMGNRGVKITYDPFFKHIFNTELHPDRLNRLLSSLMGQRVQIEKVMNSEWRHNSEDSPLLIMDLLVQLTDGRLVDVEMQRIGYHFPTERSFCYASDLLVRQHDMISAASKSQQTPFSYRSIKPVYIIVIMEKSAGPFLRDRRNYIHCSDFTFDTGLKLPSLQYFIYISLDTFRKIPHNNLSELEAWLYFLCSDNPEDIMRIIRKYPFFQELYQDIIHFRFKPKELITMYSEVLSIMDRNTVSLMIDELKADNEKKDREISKRDSKIFIMHSEISRKDSEISKKDSEISALKAQNEILLKQLNGQNK